MIEIVAFVTAQAGLLLLLGLLGLLIGLMLICKQFHNNRFTTHSQTNMLSMQFCSCSMKWFVDQKQHILCALLKCFLSLLFVLLCMCWWNCCCVLLFLSLCLCLCLCICLCVCLSLWVTAIIVSLNTSLRVLTVNIVGMGIYRISAIVIWVAHFCICCLLFCLRSYPFCSTWPLFIHSHCMWSVSTADCMFAWLVSDMHLPLMLL